MTDHPKPRSRFLQQTLMPGERIVMRAEFPWMYTARSFLVALMFVLGGMAVQWIMHTLNVQSVAGTGGTRVPDPRITRLELLPPLVGILVGGLIYLGRMAFKWTTEIVLTDKRFIYRTGVFNILVYKMEMQEINYCDVRQSLVGNILDYGTVIVLTRTLDDKNIVLPPITHPHLFSSEIERIKLGGPEHAIA